MGPPYDYPQSPRYPLTHIERVGPPPGRYRNVMVKSEDDCPIYRTHYQRVLWRTIDLGGGHDAGLKR